MLRNRILALALAFALVFTLACPVCGVSAESAESEESAESASLDASCSLEVNVDAAGTVYNGKLYLDMVNETIAIMGSMGYKSLTLMDAALYLGSAGLVVSGMPFLDQAYGIDLQNLSENLPGSVFAPDSGSSLALDQGIYDILMGNVEDVLGSQINAAAPDYELLNDSIDSLQPQLEAFVDTLMQNVQLSVGPRTLNLPTGDVKTTTSAVTVTGEVVGQALIAMLDSFAEDPEAQAALAQMYDEMVSSGMITQDEDLQDVTGEELVDAILQNQDEICQEITETLSESGLTLTGSAAVDQETEALAGFSLEIALDGETAGLEVVFAGDTYYVDVSDDGVHSGITFCIRENTESLMVATLAITERDVETNRVAFNWDKTAGTYEVTAAGSAATGTITGAITFDDTSVTVTFDQFNDESLGDTYVRLSSSDPVTVPDYREILTMTEEEILQVVQDVSDVIDRMSE